MQGIHFSLKYRPGSPERERAMEKLHQDFEECRAELLRIDRDIFGRSWWRGLFLKIPFEEHGAALVKLCARIDDLKALAQNLNHAASSDERRELALRATFLTRYRNAGAILHEICQGLLRQYGLNAYRADVARYRQALAANQ